MDEFSTPRHSSGRRTRGRPFTNGNPGRKAGSKNKTTLIGQALLKEAEEKLLRKAIEIAEAGDVPMLKFLLDRTLPKERSIHVELPKLLVDSDTVAHWERSSMGSQMGRSAPCKSRLRRRADERLRSSV
jgi:hypothetical protein